MDLQVISKRLKMVADFVPQDAVLLDVGSDHAYLPIYLIQKGQIKKAVAGEVVKGPYQSALSNVAEKNLSHAITVRLANGLEAWDESVTTISIAGMGGRLIADILEAGKDKLSTVDRLILQANNRADDVRRWLLANGFCLVAEEILNENGKYYEIMVVEKGEMTLSDTEILFGHFLSQEKSSVFVEKWEKEYDKLVKALLSVPEERVADRQLLSEKMAKIRGVLEC